nr:putative respiratory burst oxidase like protein g [Quercus suber]
MSDVQFLSQKEINDFVDHLDHDEDGCISYQELERQLDTVYEELQPEAKHYNLHHDARAVERHEFLSNLMQSDGKAALPADDFKKLIASWNIPSLEQDRQAAKREDNYLQTISWGRRLRAIWEVDGPQYLFLAFVVAAQIALGVWQCVKYATGSEYQAALGWGVGFAKACAGALYPTLFFMLLSMSRWFSTAMRKSYHISRIINWDLSQSFHIKISCVAIILATLHAIGHLSGSFVFGSRPDRQAAVATLLGPETVPKPYRSYIRSTPGWTGLTALGLFYVLAVMSMPFVRRHSYETFQIGHLLMFPIIGLLMAHGSAALLQFPVMGIVLAIPTLFILGERFVRITAGLHKIPAVLEVLDNETVSITCEIPSSRVWRYKAGQYVFLQVPQISFLQWHPFTISTCIGRKMSLHIKTDGDWTGQLRDLQGSLKFVGIDGPFGAPAQRFYDFDQTIIVGAGIGVTPFSGILTDLQTREDAHGDLGNGAYSIKDHQQIEIPLPHSPMSEKECREDFDLEKYRRVDFHWIVRDKNHLLWFSDLLNRISIGEHDPHLDIRIHNHLTKKRQDISTHIYRWLLESHRTSTQPVSALTGLIAPTHFGRPDFPKIMSNHYEDMVKLFTLDKSRKRKVGVFFCGAPIIGHTLADLCHEMTLRGREDGSGIEYHFQIEVFG